ncbi:MAG: prepilin-type N-terminal cleavage/methylation domain-containing protein [Candidatus Riflebacteria bacterium]|nr:prepilin-type N-terminal cleavage/methylation domain-containing protein [Candidatus Riflebacteria bacterium]
MNRRRGFSLMEVMIGVFIMAFVLGAFIMGLRSAKKEVEFSDKHVAVLLCSQKVVEDLMEEIWLNPFGFQTLGIENSVPSPTPIVDGQSVFFTNLESGNAATTNAPGTRKDVIGPGVKPLYHQVEDLHLTVTAERLAPVADDRPESNLYHGDIAFAWDGPRGKGKGDVEALFFSPLTPKKFTPGTYVDPSSTDASYTAILGSPGGRPQLLRNLGDVYQACRSFLNSDFYRRSFREIKELKRVSRDGQYPSKELYACHLKLAGVWYELARRSLNFLISVVPAMNAFASGYTPGSLGPMFDSGSGQLDAILRDFRLIYETLVSSILQARANYQFLVSPPMARFKGIRMQYHLINRTMDLYRVLMVTPTHRYGLSEYRYFLEQLDRFGTGRSPALRRMVAYELANSQNLGQVLNRLPNLKQLDVLFTQKMRPVLGFIRQNVTMSTP